MKFIFILAVILSPPAIAMKESNRTVASSPQAKTIKTAFDGNCAMGMCHKKIGKGKPEYFIDYKGERYLFSSEEQRDQFTAEIDKNIIKARMNYESIGTAEKR